MLSHNHLHATREARFSGTCARLRGACATVATGAFALGLGACDETPNTPVAAGALTELEADGIIYEMDDYLEADGIRSGRILADSAYVYNDSSVVQLFTMEMTLYHEDGSDRAHVTARRGTLHERSGEMVARGDVVVDIANSPERLETSELHYDPSGERIWSDSTTTRVLPDGRTTTGTCFRSTLELENIEICDIRGAADVSQPGRQGGGGRESPGGGGGGPGG
ncbi:MAG: LPS export ABC transporter periplasmic protein LptC [Gemmatimonadota bacterium]|jgi:LPS export ABC transporter protein LptC